MCSAAPKKSFNVLIGPAYRAGQPYFKVGRISLETEGDGVFRGDSYFRYYAVPRNHRKLHAFKYQVYRLWLQSLQRRSQRHRVSGERMNRLVAKWLLPVRILHPYPEQRLRVIT